MRELRLGGVRSRAHDHAARDVAITGSWEEQAGPSPGAFGGRTDLPAPRPQTSGSRVGRGEGSVVLSQQVCDGLPQRQMGPSPDYRGGSWGRGSARDLRGHTAEKQRRPRSRPPVVRAPRLLPRLGRPGGQRPSRAWEHPPRRSRSCPRHCRHLSLTLGGSSPP